MAIDSLLAVLLAALIATPIHSYILYPVAIWSISLIVRYRPPQEKGEPNVSVLISAFNEEKVIRERIANLMAQEYDPAKIEILVGSDCSSDSTNEILRELQAQYPEQMRIFLFAKRRGKAAVINDLVKEARHDILIFTDANTEFTPQAVRQLAEDYTDPKLGGVSGRIHFYESARARKDGVEEGNYFEYDSFIKEAEGNCGILIGAFGGFFSIRKMLYRPIPLDRAVTDDLFISLSVLSGGYKLYYKPQAVAYEESAHSMEQEYRRKVRYSATNFQTVSFFGDLLFGKRLLLSYALWSHKVIRWCIPVLLVLMLVVGAILYGQYPALDIVLYAQIAFYASALLGYLLSIAGIRIIVFSLPYYFVVTNIAVLAGLWRFVRGRHTIIWQPSR